MKSIKFVLVALLAACSLFATTSSNALISTKKMERAACKAAFDPSFISLTSYLEPASPSTNTTRYLLFTANYSGLWSTGYVYATITFKMRTSFGSYTTVTHQYSLQYVGVLNGVYTYVGEYPLDNVLVISNPVCTASDPGFMYPYVF